MCIMEEEQASSCGESVQTSRECQSKYLAVSPVMDNYEQLESEAVG